MKRFTKTRPGYQREYLVLPDITGYRFPASLIRAHWAEVNGTDDITDIETGFADDEEDDAPAGVPVPAVPVPAARLPTPSDVPDRSQIPLPDLDLAQIDPRLQ